MKTITRANGSLRSILRSITLSFVLIALFGVGNGACQTVVWKHPNGTDIGGQKPPSDPHPFAIDVSSAIDIVDGLTWSQPLDSQRRYFKRREQAYLKLYPESAIAGISKTSTLSRIECEIADEESPRELPIGGSQSPPRGLCSWTMQSRGV